jgi:hypothetical protein
MQKKIKLAYMAFPMLYPVKAIGTVKAMSKLLNLWQKTYAISSKQSLRVPQKITP